MDKKLPATTIDEYLAAFPAEQRELLEAVRATLRQAAPDATEAISYGIPAFKLGGSYLIYFAGYKKHWSIYPVPAGNEAFQAQIAPYQAGKGTLRFPYSEPLQTELIGRIVAHCLAANRARTAGNKGA